MSKNFFGKNYIENFSYVFSSTFICATIQKNFICMHILGVAVRLRFVSVPEECRSVPIGQKPKRGRVSKAKKVLLGAFAKMEYTFWTTVSKCTQMYAGLKYNP
jgi:hypothetical protein